MKTLFFVLGSLVWLCSLNLAHAQDSESYRVCWGEVTSGSQSDRIQLLINTVVPSHVNPNGSVEKTYSLLIKKTGVDLCKRTVSSLDKSFKTCNEDLIQDANLEEMLAGKPSKAKYSMKESSLDIVFSCESIQQGTHDGNRDDSY